MSVDKCLLEIETAAGRTLTAKERKELGEAVEAVMKKYGEADLLQPEAMKAIEEIGKNIEAAAIIENRNAALNARAKIVNREYLKNVWKDDPSEGLRAILGDSLVDRSGSKNGVAHQISSLASYYEGQVVSRLEQKKLLEFADSGKFDDQIFRAMYELGQEKPNAEAVAKLMPEAREVAKILKDAQEVARVKANEAGAWIKDLRGYVMKRSHDPLKIAQAAGEGIPLNSPQHFEAWKEFMVTNLDWDRSMPGLPQTKQADELKKIFNQLSSGEHLISSGEPVAGFKGAANIGKSLSHERVFHFKTPEAEFQYHKKFGIGDSLTENVIRGLTGLARDTAMMSKLGPNAKANLDSVAAEIHDSLVKEGNGAKAEEFRKKHQALMKNLWPIMTGEASIPGNAIWARRFQAARNVMKMGDLARVLLSQLSDVPFFGSTMRYVGERDAGSFYGGMADAIKYSIGRGTKKFTAEELAKASELGVMVESILPNNPRMDGDTDFPGRLSSWVNKTFKLGGATAWQDRLRFGAVDALSHRHGMMSHLPFEKLPEGVQSSLRQFSIEPKDWDLLRKGEIHVDSDGRKFLSPKSLDSVPDSDIAKILKDSGANPTEARIKRYRSELENNYRTLFSQVAAMATSEPSVVERSLMTGMSSNPGTAGGEIARAFWMYKSFVVSTMRKHLGREVLGYGAERLPVHKAVFEMLKHPTGSSFGGMANLILMGTVFGYASRQLKNIASGKTPEVPTDAASFAKVTMASMAQSGSLGIYGDFLFGEAKSRFGHSGVETFLGPAWGRFADINDIYQGMKNGDDVAAKAFRFMLGNTPGVNVAYNLFYTRWALDYLIVYRLQEMMNPGYLQRMERNLKKQKNQEFLVPPSRVIPYGG